jgi:hypothetical protein
MMDLNPELRRNLWLELTLHRLIAMPVVLAMVFALFYARGTDGADSAASVAVAAAWIAGLLLGGWGVRNAGDSVLEEVRARTWDAQRLSAIGPWAMTWSKLLGSVAFAWYGGLMALAVLLACAPRAWPLSAPIVAAMIVAGSLLAQASASLAGLATARKGNARRGGVGLWLLIILLVLIGPGLGLVLGQESGWHWWGEAYIRSTFLLASTACFAAWAIFGMYRAMCTELQVRTVPWAFASFTLFLIAYMAGFWVLPGASFQHVLYALMLNGMAVAGMVTYLQLFSEQTGVIVARSVQVRLARREWRRALEEMPCWPVAFAITAASSVCAALVLPGSAADERLRLLFAAPIPVLLLLTRDIAIFLFFAFARQPRRVEAAVVFYLVMLYGVIPGLFAVVGWKGAAQFLLPPLIPSPGVAVAVAAVHAAVPIALLARRWRRYLREEKA